MFENFNRRSDGGGDGVMRSIENHRSIRDLEWCSGAFTIGGIALTYRVDLSSCDSPRGTDFLTCVDIDFIIGVWKDHRPDISAFHNDAGVV